MGEAHDLHPCYAPCADDLDSPSEEAMNSRILSQAAKTAILIGTKGIKPLV